MSKRFIQKEKRNRDELFIYRVEILLKLKCPALPVEFFNRILKKNFHLKKINGFLAYVTLVVL